MRDTVKTIIGLVIIAAIVVATFMYGNHQRQAQLKKDQDAKRQTVTVSVTPQVSATTGATGTPTTGGSANTAPVSSPGSSTLQGGAQTTPQVSAGNANGQVVGAATTTVPRTGGTGALTPGAQAGQTGLPDTGAPMMGLVGLAAMIAAFIWMRRSQAALVAAARAKR